jgi:hypothetical protein
VIGGKLRLLRSPGFVGAEAAVQKDDRLALPSTSYQVLTPGSWTYSPTALLLKRGTNLTYEIAPRSAPRTAIHQSAWRNCLENREGGVSTVLFAEVRRQNRPLCPPSRLMMVPVWTLSGISKQFRKGNSGKSRCGILHRAGLLPARHPFPSLLHRAPQHNMYGCRITLLIFE